MKFDFKDLLTTGEAAVELGKSVDTVRRWHYQRKLIPAFIDRRSGKSTRYYTKDQIKEARKRIELGRL